MCVKGRVISLCLGVGVFLNCALDEPKAPSWEVDLQIPLANQNITIQDLLSDQDETFAYEDGLIGLRAEGHFDTSRVGDNLKIPDIEETIDVDIPNMTIPRLNADDATFSLKELLPDIAPHNGQNAVIPSFQFSDILGYLVPENDIVSIRLAQGVARLVYENNLPIDLEHIVFTMIEPATGEVKIVSPQIDRIAAGAKDSLDIDISGKELTCDGKWYVAGQSPGTRGQTINVDADASVSLLVDFVDFRVNSVTGRGRSFYVEHHDSVTLDPDIRIREAEFKQGTLNFDFLNGLPMDLEIIIESPQIRNKMTNGPLEVTVDAKMRVESRAIIDLAEYKIDFGEMFPGVQQLEFSFEASGESGDDEIVTISEYDSIKVKVSMKEAVLDKFRGSLDHYAISITPIDQAVKMPDDLDRFNGLNMADAHLCIDFYNAIEMPIQMRGKFSGIGSDGASATLDIDSEINPCGTDGEVLTSMPFESPGNKQILSIINLLPEKIQFSGSAFIGDGVSEGLITSESYIRGHYLLETPAKLSWRESLLVPDTTFLQINPDGSKEADLIKGALHLDAKTTNALREFVILADIENHLPVGATIEYRLADALSQAEEADLVLSPVEINAASIDVSGRTEESFKRNAKIALGGDDIAIFHNDSETPKLLSLVSKIRLHGTDGEQVKVYESDFIKIKSMAKIVVGVNME
jgi:hypothetical protein